MHLLHKVAFVLVVVGALNWGLVGLFNYNLVSYLFSQYPTVENLVYILVGAGAVVLAATHMTSCCMCSPNCNCAVPMMGSTKSKKGKKK